MFDIGFGEILVILVILLLVVGPERLPTVARTTAVWIRKARRLVAQIKHEVEQELQAEELRQSLKEDKDRFNLNNVNSKPTPLKSGAGKEEHPDSKPPTKGTSNNDA